MPLERLLHIIDQRQFCVMGEGTYALGRVVSLPAAGAPIQTDVKTAKILTSMPDARLRLGEILRCIVLKGVGIDKSRQFTEGNGEEESS